MTPPRVLMNILPTTIIIFMALTACAIGPGKGPEEDSGAAGLSLQLHGLEEGQVYLSNDGYRLSFSRFALAFSGFQLGDFGAAGPFQGDIFEAEAVDRVEIEEVTAGEYDLVALTFGLGIEGSDPAELAGFSLFLEAQAVNGGNACTLQVAILADGERVEVDPEGQLVDVHVGEESEVLVEVDPNDVFTGVHLGGLCQDDVVLTISAEENAALADLILENLAGAFSLGRSEEHHHHKFE